MAGDQKQFNVLLRTHYVGTDESIDKDISATERAAIARAIQSQAITINWKSPSAQDLLADIDKKFGTQSALLKAEVKFSLELIVFLNKSSRLDEALSESINKLNTVIFIHAIADAQFWLKDSALKHTINYLYGQMLGWSANEDKTTQKIAALFEKTVGALLNVPLQDQEAIKSFDVGMRGDFHQLMDKFARLANRLKETEVGLLKAVACKHTVTQVLNEITQDKRLPNYITQFLQNKWLHEMQILLINQGEGSSFWLRWKKLVEVVVKMYQIDVVADTDTLNKKILSTTSNEIELLMKESLRDSEDFQEFSNEVAFDFSQKSRNEVIEGLVPVEQLVIGAELQGIEKKITKTLLNKAKAFELGQWFIYTDESGSHIRCRLLATAPEYNHLFFVNIFGQKALVLDYEKFAYLLSGKHMQALWQNEPIQQCFISVIEKLLKNFSDLYEAKQSSRKQKELEAKQAKEENERRKAAEKAKAEAEAIAQRKADEEQALILIQMEDDLKRQARLAINSLALGSWVDIKDEDTQEFKRIKLAVKYNATGRFVFVDADGVTIADCQRDDLVELMMKRKLKLLESDSLFADRLTKIIKGIRKVE